MSKSVTDKLCHACRFAWYKGRRRFHWCTAGVKWRCMVNLLVLFLVVVWLGVTRFARGGVFQSGEFFCGVRFLRVEVANPQYLPTPDP